MPKRDPDLLRRQLMPWSGIWRSWEATLGQGVGMCPELTERFSAVRVVPLLGLPTASKI
jgi:hypothetical protein